MFGTVDSVVEAYLSAENPHPEALKASASIIRCRARRVTNDAEQLNQLAGVYWDYAQHLSASPNIEWWTACYKLGLNEPSGDRLALQHFPIPGFSGRTLSSTRFGAGLQVRTFNVFEPLDGDASTCDRRPKLVARMAMIEHLSRLLWEVLDIEVAPEFRRQGVAAALYNAAERFVGAKILSPSGWLTGDALSFWADRKPGVAGCFRQHPHSGGLYLSPKQFLFMRKAASWHVLRKANRPDEYRLP